MKNKSPAAVIPRESSGSSGTLLERIIEMNEALVLSAVRLHELTEQLEHVVAERTAALRASNAKLRESITTVEKGREEFRLLFLESEAAQKKLRGLTRKFLKIQEEERREISRELHDAVIQTLVSVNVDLALLENPGPLGPAALNQKIACSQRRVADAVNAVHRFAREIRPTVLDDLGLNPALHSYLEDFLERTGIRVNFSTCVGIELLSPAKRTTLFRVAQEALTNVARHSGVSCADLSLSDSGVAAHMEIRDEGKGFEVDGKSGAHRTGRLGLLGIKERVEMAGGTFFIKSSIGGPTTLHVEIPHSGRKKKRGL